MTPKVSIKYPASLNLLYCDGDFVSDRMFNRASVFIENLWSLKNKVIRFLYVSCYTPGLYMILVFSLVVTNGFV